MQKKDRRIILKDEKSAESSIYSLKVHTWVPPYFLRTSHISYIISSLKNLMGCNS